MVAFEALRFPIIFGGFLAAVSVAFWNKEKFLPNMEEEGRKMHQNENASDRQMLADKIKEMKSK